MYYVGPEELRLGHWRTLGLVLRLGGRFIDSSPSVNASA